MKIRGTIANGKNNLVSKGNFGKSFLEVLIEVDCPINHPSLSPLNDIN